MQSLDLYWEIVCGRKVKVRGGTVALETIFGFVFSGPIDISSDSHEEAVTASFYVEIKCVRTSTLEDILLKFWSLESLGIQEKNTTKEKFTRNIAFKKGHYEVQLPWKKNINC